MESASPSSAQTQMDLLSLKVSPKILASRTQSIYQSVLVESRHMKSGNFAALDTDDVSRMFYLYDGQFFSGWLASAVQAASDSPLTFRLSGTMTSAGGKTIRTRTRGRPGQQRTHYQIAIASRLLFMTFSDVDRTVTVCGIVCTDRLQAMQRIMEHEILHLAEMVAWNESSCSAPRFKRLAVNIFGHPDTRHHLVTPREHAAVRHDIRVGSVVEFSFDRRKYVGRVNRIHHRATVLVESEEGVRYTNGRYYRKFYVPLGELRLTQMR
jgi:hypothetical protein